MPEFIKKAWQDLKDLLAFVSFATQEDAIAAGVPAVEAKAYVANEDEKNWRDPDANKPGPGKRHFNVKGVPWVMYLNGTFTGKLVDAEQNGIVEDLAMPVAEALKLNILPKGTGMTNVPATGRVVPVPLSAPLAPTQKIRREMPLGPWKIRNLDVILSTEQASQDAQSTAAAVVRIEAKVDRMLAELHIT